MSDKLRDATLCFLITEEEGEIKQICLAMKKRGFGNGRWNGVGGKVEPTESIEEAATRETREEIGVSVSKLEKVATLTFLFPHNESWNQVVHVYFCFQWDGEALESEEMNPQWFVLRDIPYARMWADDAIWLPRVLAGNKVRATFTFGEGDVVLNHTLEKVEADEL